jgi:glycerol-3-phosphate dehydrogenase
MRIAPHLIHPLLVMVPTYDHWAKEVLAAAVRMNDLIRRSRNRIKDPGKRIPAGKVLSTSECLEIFRTFREKDSPAQAHEDAAVLTAEALHAVRDEMAHELSDMVARRTDLGSTGYPGTEALEICASVISAELGWSPDKKRVEIEETMRAFRIGGYD